MSTVNVKLKEAAVELASKSIDRATLDHEGGGLLYSRVTTLGKKNLVKSEFTCLHLSLVK